MSNGKPDNIFQPASEDEVKERYEKWIEEEYLPKILPKWKEEFLKRDDISQNSDGSYDVHADIICLNILSIPFRLHAVKGHMILEKLEDLENFPKEVKGDIILLNCKVSREDVKKINKDFTVRTGTVGLP